MHVVRLIQLALGAPEERGSEQRSGTQAYVALQRSTDAVIMTNAAGLIDYLNPVAESLLNCELRNVLGRPAPDLISFIDGPSGADVANPLIACMRHDRDTAVGENVSLAVRGRKPIPVQGSAAPVKEPDGRPALDPTSHRCTLTP